MSKCNAQQLLQDGSCFLCVDSGIRQVLELQLLCEILNNGIGGGSGIGTVTSFSSGSLSPLFTTSVATATTTPALTFTLSTQTANTLFAGPTTGAAASPTFRAMVNADFGTTLTPQFARIGIGQAADATVKLSVTGASAGAGANVFVGVFTVPTSNPFLVVGDASNDSGGFIGYDRANTKLALGIYGHTGFTVDSTGLVSSPVGFDVGGIAGVSNTFNGSNTVTVIGGIVVGIA